MKLDKHGKQCPKPVIDTKKALGSCNPGEAVEVLVDNKIVVQSLSEMAASKGLSAASKKISDDELSVKIPVDQGVTPVPEAPGDSNEGPAARLPGSRKEGITVVPSSNLMGHGDPELGKALMKGSVHASAQRDVLLEAILLYNGGTHPSCEGSDNLENLKSMESQGIEILICGACLSFYGLSKEPRVDSVTNMYEVVERMTAVKLLMRP